ncbi:beta-1,3-galactosyl-O-glycosyl-glycoprotein beta-1,6-N-acetylglucosaminyltransferase 7 [Triplophysa dalaica]|uniref:beta-1,3-galactosyl-O-glycosyl-glycoprotein beta-1,6-N-acetylglucosaminyltransferase 7 n=1 Tax=Triplophysa dalaica TaxID=1582913 RepID=UPI0024DFB8DF|nr:beta-1,3-galactosyl-O-glycosyl-glycoprotein beta-1,6-N-acetylglucosaminyltransferase 7 [Triplophysa dalaica]
MVQLESVKCSFLLCLGICIIFCSAIYLKAKISNAPQAFVITCQLLPENCPILPSPTPAFRWERQDCTINKIVDAETNCSRLRSELHFITVPLSKEEKDFPLAFIITIHKELEAFVRLLRSIYTPQNIYCVHVDAKAPADYKTSVWNLVRCLPNVFLASVSERVTYAGFSRLKADINCMKDLMRSPVKWRRVINLCGQDFPIQTNLELVRYMRGSEWRGKNMAPGVRQPPYIRHRTRYQYVEVKDSVAPRGRGQTKGPPPHNLTIYFGTAYYSLTRAFAQYVINSAVAKDLLSWSRDTFSPDEHYWVTLNHVEEAPGSDVNGGWEGNIRAIKWKDQEGTSHRGCKGRYVRDICIFGTGDLPWVVEKYSMFANKFETTSFPKALDCLELWHRHKVLQQASVPVQPSWQLITEVPESTETQQQSTTLSFP